MTALVILILTEIAPTMPAEHYADREAFRDRPKLTRYQPMNKTSWKMVEVWLSPSRSTVWRGYIVHLSFANRTCALPHAVPGVAPSYPQASKFSH